MCYSVGIHVWQYAQSMINQEAHSNFGAQSFIGPSLYSMIDWLIADKVELNL